jgi:hypothetical protein
VSDSCPGPERPRDRLFGALNAELGEALRVGDFGAAQAAHEALADFSKMTASRERWSTWPRSARSERNPELREASRTAGQNPLTVTGRELLAVRREPDEDEFFATTPGKLCEGSIEAARCPFRP